MDMRKFLTLFTIVIGALLLFILPTNESALAQANELHDYYIHALIHSDGSATITEKVNATLTEGTEFFRRVESLGTSKITNFTVEENRRTYDFVDNWSFDASFEEKAYKNSIIDISSGHELVWGISEYGLHEYEYKYKITDFIKELDDSQVLLYRFINEMNLPTENITVEIEAEEGLNISESNVSVFGSNNNTSFDNDKFVISNSVPFTTTDYVTVLMKFPKD